MAALKDMLGQMTAALAEGDVKAYLAADTLFHLRFLENCDNAHLLETYKVLPADLAPPAVVRSGNSALRRPRRVPDT